MGQVTEHFGKVTIRDLPADLKASEAGDNGGKQPDRDDKGNNGNGANPQKPPSQSGAAGEDKQPAQPPKGERRKKAEETRDAILGDIKDARQKKKAELLANAAIAGVKVKKLKAKLTADGRGHRVLHRVHEGWHELRRRRLRRHGCVIEEEAPAVLDGVRCRAPLQLIHGE